MAAYYEHGGVVIHCGDALEVLRGLPDGSVHCCVTSPPYWGLRDYGTASWEGGDAECDHKDRNARGPAERRASTLEGGVATIAAQDAGARARQFCHCGARRIDQQLGLEPTPEEYVSRMVEVFREVRRVLRDDGTLWLNLGDSYATGGGRVGDAPGGGKQGEAWRIRGLMTTPNRLPLAGLKPKDLIGIPWSVAKALQSPYYTGRIQRERDRVWMAAILDGEGTICGFTHERKEHTETHHSIRTGAHVFVTNSSMAMLAECQRIWHASQSRHMKPTEGHLGDLPTDRWIIQGIENKQQFLREIYPYLIVKRNQAIAAYTLLEMMADAKHLGHTPERRDVWDKRKRLVEIMSDLNHQRSVDLPDWCVEPPSCLEPGWYLRSDIIWCLSGGTWVYARTQKGDMPMTIKDIYRLKPETVQLWNGQKWTRLRGMSKNKRCGTELEIVLRSGERISCTATHKFPTNRGLVEASEVRVGDVLESTVLPEPETPREPSCIGVDAAWFAGLYIAEGSRSGDTIQIAGHAKETARWERVRQIAEAYGGTATRTVSGNCMDIRVYGKVLNAIIDEFVTGRTAKDKGFAPIVWRYGNGFVAALVDGYLSGDGHHDTKNDRWRLGFTRNYNLERDLRAACARLGYSLVLKMASVPYNGTRRPTFRGELRKTRSGHHNERPLSQVVDIRKARCREVYDLGVADEPHLFALASGILTHNSKPNPMPESVTDRPTKAHEYLFMLTKNPTYYYDAEAIREPHADVNVVDGAYQGRGGVSRADYIPNTQGFNGSGICMKNRQYNPHGRNKRSVWTVATQPNSLETSRRVRVRVDGPCDGSQRITSPDCPLHGDHPVPVSSVPCDGHASGLSSRNGHTSNHHDPERQGDCVPIVRPREGCSAAGSSDSPARSCSDAATGHNTQASRTALDPATNLPCMPCAQTADGIGRTEAEHATSDSAEHTPASSIVVDSAQGALDSDPSGQIQNRSAGICTCEYYITKTEKTAHFATFPTALIEPCIKAGCPAGGTVLDPFGGSGTTGQVARAMGCCSVLIELNEKYCRMAANRLRQDVLDLAEVSA